MERERRHGVDRTRKEKQEKKIGRHQRLKAQREKKSETRTPRRHTEENIRIK
jgi:hypothetical protein